MKRNRFRSAGPLLAPALALATIGLGAGALMTPQPALAQRYDDGQSRERSADPGDFRDDEGDEPGSTYRGGPSAGDVARDRDREQYADDGPPPGVAPADYFYDALKPLGRWVEHWKYGLVWYPRDVDEDWRPYTIGRWVLTDDYGWLWDSEEPWGWAVFHYGRWTLDEDWGWIWIPGNEWGPAWVDWRESDDHVGWAPLPPEVRWRGDRFDYRGVDLDSSRYRSAWVFVPAAALVSYSIHRHIVPRSRNATYVRQSKRSTNYAYIDRRYVNRSLNLGRIERATGRPIVSVRVIDANRPNFERRRYDRDGRGPGRGDGPPRGDGGVSLRIGDIEIFRPFDRGRRRANVDPAALPPSAGQPGVSGDRRGARGQGGTGDGQRGGRGQGQQPVAPPPAAVGTPPASPPPAAGAPPPTAPPATANVPPPGQTPGAAPGGTRGDGPRGDGTRGDGTRRGDGTGRGGPPTAGQPAGAPAAATQPATPPASGPAAAGVTAPQTSPPGAPPFAGSAASPTPPTASPSPSGAAPGIRAAPPPSPSPAGQSAGAPPTPPPSPPPVTTAPAPPANTAGTPAPTPPAPAASGAPKPPGPSEAERLNRSQVIERVQTPPDRRPPDIDRRQAEERREQRQLQDEQRQRNENRAQGVRPGDGEREGPPRQRPQAAPPAPPATAPPAQAAQPPPPRPQAVPPPPPPPPPKPQAAPPPPPPPPRPQAAPPPPPPKPQPPPPAAKPQPPPGTPPADGAPAKPPS